MYDFHYNYIKKKYGDQAQLLFTDTDSLTYEIEIKDVSTKTFRLTEINSITAITLKVVNSMTKRIKRSMIQSKMK